MAYYGMQPDPGDRPDRPLVVKCSFDRSLRRITFASAKNCNYILLRARVSKPLGMLTIKDLELTLKWGSLWVYR